MKCNMDTSFPGPCSRCTRRKEECVPFVSHRLAHQRKRSKGATLVSKDASIIFNYAADATAAALTSAAEDDLAGGPVNSVMDGSQDSAVNGVAVVSLGVAVPPADKLRLDAPIALEVRMEPMLVEM
jgi:hypothetical protein